MKRPVSIITRYDDGTWDYVVVKPEQPRRSLRDALHKRLQETRRKLIVWRQEKTIRQRIEDRWAGQPPAYLSGKGKTDD